MPIWLSIAAEMRAGIAEGQYETGSKLPTEAALADRFGVNRHTVRHALSHLVEEGLIRSRRGAGSFVISRPTDYPIGQRVRFHENLLAAGRQPEKRVLMMENRAATQGEASALSIQQGDPVCAYHGLSFADTQPIAIFESLFPVDRLPTIEAALQHHSSVTAALEEAGISKYTRTTTRLTAVLASTSQALHLQVRPGDPLIKSTGVNADLLGNPVEYGRTYFVGDRVTLTLDT